MLDWNSVCLQTGLPVSSTGELAVHVYGGLKTAMSQHFIKSDIQKLHDMCFINQSSLDVIFVLISVLYCCSFIPIGHICSSLKC